MLKRTDYCGKIRAEDIGRYYRIPADNRDLNYNMYVSDGELEISRLDDYTSHNTDRLDVHQLKNLLRDLDFIRMQLNAWRWGWMPLLYTPQCFMQKSSYTMQRPLNWL